MHYRLTMSGLILKNFFQLKQNMKFPESETAQTKMKRLPYWKRVLAAGIISITPFVGYAQETKQERSAAAITNAEIEGEVNKYGKWILGYVKSDYSAAEGPGFAKLRRRPAGEIQKMQETGFLGDHGSYNYDDDTISIPTPANEDEKEEDIEGVDHEIFHSLLDDKNKKGMIFWKGYQGPSKEEIEEYARAKIAGPEFNFIKREMRFAGTMQIQAAKKKAAESFMRYRIRKITEKQGSFDSNYKNYKQYEKYLARKDVELVEASSARIEESRKKAISDLRLLEKDVTYLGARQKQLPRGKEMTEETMELYEKFALEETEFLDRCINILNQEKGYLDQLDEANKLLMDMGFRGIAARIDNDIARYSQMKSRDPSNAKHYDYLISIARKEKETMAYMKQQLDASWALNIDEDALEHLTSLEYYIPALLNISEIEKITQDPQEVFARMGDSLMNVYFGPIGQKLYPITDHDIGFWRRFRYKGQLMFGKQVEKAETGMQMIRDGYTPLQVRQLLEYAEAFTYKERTYSWPAAGFRIRGEIPEAGMK